jgi:hypothetical protein
VDDRNRNVCLRHFDVDAFSWILGATMPYKYAGFGAGPFTRKQKIGLGITLFILVVFYLVFLSGCTSPTDWNGIDKVIQRTSP